MLFPILSGLLKEILTGSPTRFEQLCQIMPLAGNTLPYLPEGVAFIIVHSAI